MFFSFKDARDYQILFLSLFLSLGIMTRAWTIRIDCVVVALISCLLTQFILTCWSVNELKQQESFFLSNGVLSLKNFLSLI
ncbi:hypothetical protein [Chroococcus sp. FPU101]|uniref:hypothetical protein n=1 Tax=Chroococcus sp. FPU101 TaxID=1974212 RepID=UPI001F5C4EC9|nr:hypothetical protein [Chroococcus sp. FPU101]